MDLMEMYGQSMAPELRTAFFQALQLPSGATVEDIAFIPMDRASKVLELALVNDQLATPHQLGRLMKPLRLAAAEVARFQAGTASAAPLRARRR